MGPIRGIVEIPADELVSVRVIGGRAAMVLGIALAGFPRIDWRLEPFDRGIKPFNLEQIAPKPRGKVGFKNSHINLLHRFFVNFSHASDYFEKLRINFLVKLHDFPVQRAIGFSQHRQAGFGLLPDVSQRQANLVRRPFDGELLGHSESIGQSLDFDDFLADPIIGQG
jgi:hypothetical protein